MKLADLTWEEAGKKLKKKNSLIIPSGMTEQHSLHLPLNTDTLVAEHIADYLSEKTGLPAAPAINYGVGLPCDIHYPGGASADYAALKNYVSSLLNWWEKQGIKRFFFITAHGDPFHIKALKEASRDRGDVLELYDIDLRGILERQECARHACEAETSVMLYLFPGAVRKGKIKDFETPFEKFRPYLFHKNKRPIPGSPGCQGYPSSANAEKGKRILRLMRKNALAWLKKRIKNRREK